MVSPLVGSTVVALNHHQKSAAEDSLREKLADVDVEVLDVSVGSAPVFTVHVKGNRVPTDVLDAARRFGATKVLSVRSSTWTQGGPDSMSVTFEW